MKINFRRPALITIIALTFAATLTAALSLTQTGCTGWSKSLPDTPAWNPYIEAFTSGRVPRGGSVSIVFSQTPREGLRTAEALKRAVSLRPRVSGRWEWQDERTAVFRPEDGFRRDTRYRVNVDLGRLMDARGDQADFTFGFQTLPLALRAGRVQFSAGADDGLCQVTIETASPDVETPETIERMVSVSEHTAVQWTHTDGGNSHTMRLERVVAGDESRNLVVTADGRELASVYIPAKNEFGIYSSAYVSSPEKYIEVTFTKGLDEGQNMNGLAYIAGEETPSVVNVEGNRLRLYPSAGEARTVEVVLSAAIRSASGLILGEDVIREVEISGEVPAFRFVGRGVVIPRSRELTIPFEAVWLRGVTVSVIRIFERNAGQFLQVNNLDGGDEVMRVGRLVARKTIWLDEEAADLGSWKTYAIDLASLIEPEPGAIYRVELDMRQDLSALPCEGAEPQKSKSQIAAEDEASLRSRMASEDGGMYYYYDNNIDWRRYNWNEREDPCKYSFWADRKAARNVVATDLGLIVKTDATGEMTALVHNLLTTAPMPGVKVEAFNFQGQTVASAITDEGGMARFGAPGVKAWYVTASHETQRTWLRVDAASSLSTSSFDVSGEAVQSGVKGFIYGERGVWRPGDVIHVGFMLADRTGSLPPNIPVVAALYDPMGQLYLRKTATEGRMGLYTFEMPTEADARTGAWRVQVEVGGATFTKRVRVETIKPNRLKIDFGFDGRRLLLAPRDSTAIRASLAVEWLTGATARNLKWESDVTVRSVETRFAGFDGFSFDDRAKNFESRQSRVVSGTLDAGGHARVPFLFSTGASAPGMLAAGFTTRVYEESGEFSTDGLTIGYSPYERYAGVLSPQSGESQLDTGRDHTFSVAMVNYEGRQLVNQTARVDVYKVEWHWWWDSSGGNLADYLANSYNRPEETLTVKTGTDGRGTFTLNMADDQWGTYYIRVSDTVGRHTAGTMAYFDWPNSWRRGREGGDGATELKFTTDRDTYAPGDTIKVSLPSSPGARAVVSVENGTRVVSIASHECAATETVIPIAVTADMQPGVYVHTTLLQPHAATANDVSIRLYGIVPVTVTSPASHLNPVVKTPEEIRPEARYEISVGERDGRPMAYTVAVVDEGLLDLTRFATPDPWTAFNAREALGVSTFDMYNYVVGAYGGRIESLFSIGGDGELDPNAPSSVNRFRPVVRFEGPFTLKAGETRRHSWTMDNYNGRVRVMVVAGDGKAWGSAQQSVPVRKPVMLLGTLPRVIGTGEEMDVPATVFATRDGVGTINVSIAASPGMTVVGAARRTVDLPVTGDRTVTFRVKTGGASGPGRVTITAAGGGEQSVWETDIEVRSVRRPQTLLTAATVAADETWNRDIPLPGADGTNSLELEVSSIPPMNLAGRLRYLLGYPHGCLEQITSKSFPQLYLAGFTTLNERQQADSQAAIAETIRRYRSYQTAEGALAYWPGGTGTDAFTSVYALHFMVEAEARGHLVPAALKLSVMDNLRLVARGWRPGTDPWAGSERLTQAYRLWVLALAGSAETGAMNRLREDPSLAGEARWMLAAAYATVGRRDVAGTLTDATVPMTEGFDSEYDATWGSPLREKAVRLIVLTMMDRADEAARLCREISTELSSQRWISTQSTAWALSAVSRYAGRWAATDKMRFDWEAGGKNNHGSVNTEGSVWTHTTTEKAPGGKLAVSLENRGSGTLFLRVLATGIPDQGAEEAYADGITLDTRWIDAGGRAVNPDSLARGTALTAVVTVANPGSRAVRNLVLTQVFPAGWEILSTRWMDSGVANGNNTGTAGDGTAAGISYQNIRDDRVYTYIDYLPAGRNVTVRLNLAATYGGRFHLPPVWCEAMYDETVRANTEGRTVTVN